MKLEQARVARLLAAVLSAAILLGGCGGASSPDSKSESGSAAGTKESKDEQPILTATEVAGVWKSYNERNNAAMPKAGPPAYDGAAYSVADTGPLLQEDLTSAAFRRNTGRKASTPFTTTPRDLYAPTVGAGFALSSVTESFAPRASSLTSLVEDGDAWKKEMGVDLPQGTRLPAPLAPGKDSIATEADVSRVREVAAAVGSFWSTLKRPADVDLGTAREVYFVNTLRNIRENEKVLSGGVDVGDPCEAGQPGTDAVRVVRARSGLLALVCLQVRDHLRTTQPGVTISDTGQVADVFGKESRRSIQHRWLCTLALSVPDSGQAVVLGVNSIPVAP